MCSATHFSGPIHAANENKSDAWLGAHLSIVFFRGNCSVHVLLHLFFFCDFVSVVLSQANIRTKGRVKSNTCVVNFSANTCYTCRLLIIRRSNTTTCSSKQASSSRGGLSRDWKYVYHVLFGWGKHANGGSDVRDGSDTYKVNTPRIAYNVNGSIKYATYAVMSSVAHAIHVKLNYTSG